MIDAINAGRIPPAFQEDLQARANELVNTVNCPPPTPAPSDEANPEEKKNGKKKDRQDEASEEELVPLPTVTDGEG